MMNPITTTILKRELVNSHRWSLVCGVLNRALFEAGVRDKWIPLSPFEIRTDPRGACIIANQELAKQNLPFVFTLNDKEEQVVEFNLCRDIIV